jgi:hypothetical protein
MPGENPSDETTPEIPSDYGEAYQRAYRQSLAAHPTELMSPARPGKRAAKPEGKWAAVVADVLADQRRLRLVVAAGVVLLLLLAYGAGRLVAAA